MLHVICLIILGLFIFGIILTLWFILNDPNKDTEEQFNNWVKDPYQYKNPYQDKNPYKK